MELSVLENPKMTKEIVTKHFEIMKICGFKVDTVNQKKLVIVSFTWNLTVCVEWLVVHVNKSIFYSIWGSLSVEKEKEDLNQVYGVS